MSVKSVRWSLRYKFPRFCCCSKLRLCSSWTTPDGCLVCLVIDIVLSRCRRVTVVGRVSIVRYVPHPSPSARRSLCSSVNKRKLAISQAFHHLLKRMRRVPSCCHFTVVCRLSVTSTSISSCYFCQYRQTVGNHYGADRRWLCSRP